MHSPAKSSYQFGAFHLDPAGRALLHGTKRLELPPRVFDTLLALVEEKGQLVEKAKLMQTVWPDTAVEENNLSQAVYVLRKILRDGEDGIRYIETVPKQGYRFVARVREVGADEDTAVGTPSSAETGHGGVQNPGQRLAPQTETPSPSPAVLVAKSYWLVWMLAGQTIVLLVLAGVLANWRDQRGNQVGLETIRSVAVLPLQNLSNDPEQEYFADGMTDELITDLAQVRELRVVSKTSIMQYKSVHRPLREIGRELGVDAVVEGSVLRSGDRVRITAQLIRTATDTHLWAKSYEGEMKDVLSLQALVAEAITGEVKLNLTAAEHNRLHRPHRVNPDVYEAYLKGRYYWNQRSDEGFQKAVEYFNQAIEKEPDFALGYAGLADCFILMALNAPDPDLMAKAGTSAQRALALDDSLAEAHTSLAAVKIFRDWDWAGAENEFQSALELNPNYAPAHHWYGNLLLGPMGRHEEAMAELKRAQSLDPLSLIINTDVGYADYLARRYAAAFSQYQKVLAMDPNFVSARYDLGRYYQHMGMISEWLDQLDARYMDQERARAIRKLYAEGGYRRLLLESALTQGTFHAAGTRGSFCISAESYAAIGLNRDALSSLEQCYKAREPGLIYIKVDPAWDNLRGDAAFLSVEHRIGLQ